MKKRSRNILITGATGDIAQALIKKLPDDHLFLISRTLPMPDLPDQIDILINNAGFGIFERLEHLSESQIDEMFKVNVIDAIKLTKSLQPTRLINIASIAGKIPTEKSNIYAASKAALIVFGEAMRMEGMSVLNVNTGPVKTKFHVENPEYIEKVKKHAITADDLADQIIKHFDSKKRELNLPWSVALVAKLRAIFPRTVDLLGNKFFNYK